MRWLPAPRTLFVCEGNLFRPLERKEVGETLWVDLNFCKKQGEAYFSSVSGKVSLRTPQHFNDDLTAGDVVRFQSSLKLPRDFKNPGSFSSTDYYRSVGVDALGFVSDPVWVVRLQSPRDAPFQKGLEKIRKQVRRAVTMATDPPASYFLLGLLTGERKELGDMWEENFKKAGVSHILSISGLHVTMVALFFLFLLKVLPAFPMIARYVLFLRLCPLAAIPLIWLYVAVAGFPVPAVRAGFAATLLLVGLSCWRKLDLLSALALAAFLVLSGSPLLLFQASFQLSFVAVAFLILFFPRWRRWREGWRKFSPAVGWILDGLAVSFITLWGLVPILLFHFHEASLMGIVANLIIVPLVNFLVMPLGIAGWFLSGLLGLDVPWLWKMAGLFASMTLRFVSFFAAHSDWGLFHGAVKLWQIPFYYGAIFVFLGQKRRLALALSLMAIFCSGYMLPKSSDLKVTFLDVGQGDSAVIELPDGKVWVLDGGGTKGSDWDIGRYVVAPYLWENNIHKVDSLFLSHPHHDHYKGLGFLAEHFSPKVLYVNGDAAPEAEGEEWLDFLERVGKNAVPIQIVTAKTPPLESGGVRLEFLAPGSGGTVEHFDTNDNSIVMKLSYKNIRFLFPGDLMEAGETLLLASKPDLKADVLKLGHHGSETSTKKPFLDAVRPQYAIISAGLYNEYGVPDEEVLERLRNGNIRILRTDLQGALTFKTDGSRLDVSPFVP